jgi:nicotinamide-nucleotide amidase
MESDRLARVIGDRLAGRTLTTAESCTGGLVAQTFAATEGSLDWFRGGIVAYQRAVKQSLLDVRNAPLVSEAVAEDMATGAAKLFDADVAVAVTGAAGPAPLDGAPPGTVVIAVSIDGEVSSTKQHFDGVPEEVVRCARDAALVALMSRLDGPNARRM